MPSSQYDVLSHHMVVWRLQVQGGEGDVEITRPVFQAPSMCVCRSTAKASMTGRGCTCRSKPSMRCGRLRFEERHMVRIDRIAICLACVALSMPAHGQQQPSQLEPAGGPFSQVPVLNAPFSADATTTVTAIALRRLTSTP